MSTECANGTDLSIFLSCVSRNVMMLGKRAKIAPVVAKRHWKYSETKATACHFAMLLRVSQGRFDCSPRIFSNRGWLPREIDPDGYSEIVRTQRDVLEDHRCVEYFLTLIHSTPVALNPIAAFFQNSKTVTLTRKVWKTLKRLLCIFSARHYFTVYVREIVPKQGHVMKGKLPGCVHNAYYSDHIR